ncbi:unnamed protein product [Porites evermanni]|uniref:Schwannomin interacting protein 1 C-terminal domain-containing protein n=1 Tax=Porites evermanni TaxID=104178 RepID=A0ABN8SUI5_9CNID|nr:unnamed protein product [Porites evermanni]
MEPRTPTASINGGSYQCDESSYQDTGVFDRDGNMLPDLLDSQVDSTLQGLDMGAIKKNSYNRTRAAMAAINPTIAKKVLPLASDDLSEEEEAAICIQAHFRGYLARKLFVQLLYDKYIREEEEMESKRRQQVMEGELLVENYRLNLEMEENTCLRKNTRRGKECDVITIQRAWREHKRRSEDHLTPEHGRVNPFNKPDFGTVTQPAYSTPDNNGVHIRTNPFMGGNENSTHHDDDALSDVFNDSLEQVTEENLRNTQEHGPRRQLCDNYQETEDDILNGDAPGLDSISSPAELPSPTTDWESIESCLTSEGDTQELLDQTELLDSSNDRLKQLSLKPKNLQICFVDDTMLSDVEGDEDSCLIKEYIIDKQEVSDEEKRDSGCVAGDDEMSESFSIKTVPPEMLENHEISQEDSEKVLLELSKQESEEDKSESCSTVMLGWTEERLSELTIDELRELKKNMAQLIEAQNEVLVTELMNRDSLHLRQDSLLMDVEDASK